MNPSGRESIAYGFPGTSDGSYPYSGVTRDSSNNLYGTAYQGGVSNAGMVYMLNPSGQETVLYSFTGGADGGNPEAGVTRDSSGNLYGTTYNGGASLCGSAAIGCGVVYKIDAADHYSVLYTLTAGNAGGNPQSPVTLDSAGNIYGTTSAGGNCGSLYGCGVVYELSTTGQLTVLHNFRGGGYGKFPLSGVIRDSAGNLYGSTYSGGAGYGVVYKLGTAGHQSVLYTFTGGADGGNPKCGLIQDPSGKVYGTTSASGSANAGVVFEVSTTGQETIIYSLTGGADGASRAAGVVSDPQLNLCGTTQGDGSGTTGVVYKLVPLPGGARERAAGRIG